MEPIIILWPVFFSAVTFFAFGIDKGRAKKGQWRIPEKALFTLAALGGGLGGWLGMRIFRHKTKHATFRIGIPLLTVANLLVAGGLCFLL